MKFKIPTLSRQHMRDKGGATQTLEEKTAPAGSYSFSAVQFAVWLFSLSSTAIFIVFPSGCTVMRDTLMTLPFRLSVSSIVFASIFFSDTLVVPGSPLYG